MRSIHAIHLRRRPLDSRTRRGQRPPRGRRTPMFASPRSLSLPIEKSLRGERHPPRPDHYEVAANVEQVENPGDPSGSQRLYGADLRRCETACEVSGPSFSPLGVTRDGSRRRLRRYVTPCVALGPPPTPRVARSTTPKPTPRRPPPRASPRPTQRDPRPRPTTSYSQPVRRSAITIFGVVLE